MLEILPHYPHLFPSSYDYLIDWIACSATELL